MERQKKVQLLLLNVYSSDSDIMSKTTRGDDGKDRLENGNYIEETASHYVTVVEGRKIFYSYDYYEIYSKKEIQKMEFNDDVFETEKKKDGKGFFQTCTIYSTILS